MKAKINKTWQKREQSLDFWLHIEHLTRSGKLTQKRISTIKDKLERSKQRTPKK